MRTIHFSFFSSIKTVGATVFGGLLGIDENNTFQLKFYSLDKTNTFQLKFSISKTVGATVLGGLWD